MSVYSGVSRISRRGPPTSLGGAKVQRDDFSENYYLKAKELDHLGGPAPGAPSGFANL